MNRFLSVASISCFPQQALLDGVILLLLPSCTLFITSYCCDSFSLPLLEHEGSFNLSSAQPSGEMPVLYILFDVLRIWLVVIKAQLFTVTVCNLVQDAQVFFFFFWVG